ncbi:hypothetical protein FHT80_003733 [Rhizobium sp. BK226]|uniref:hypothetical protein n=1 Tax=Rhizobium TaxID=379 RepID=UPI000BE95C64|nr:MULTISPECIES: hypothetical protein [Rhizobium]MBB4114382.1 hypothetical protein [Rhizobium sp. BK226]PDS58692.1 hypothetical protein CO663_13065 [Rhizobium anhuiense]PDS65622.1 hypothetical protein CO653_11870 [Rhizobium anhuiense]
MELNTREIATLIWLGIVVAILLVMPTMRQSLGGLLRAFTQRKILQVLAFFALYVGAMIWFLHAVCIWDWDQLKNTIVWTFSVALIAVLRGNKFPDEPGYFRRWITENFQLLAFIQFLVTLYTYPLWVELLVIPLVTLLTGMIAVGDRDPKTKQAVFVLTNILALFMLGFFGLALVMTVEDFWNYATIQTWRDFYTPIVLTLLFLPFIFVLYVLMSYESAFVGLYFSIEDTKLRRSAQWRAILAFGPDVDLMRRWQRHVAMHRPQSKDDIKAGISEIKEARHRERTKPPVAAALGWPPAIARDFLHDLGLPTRDYHRSCEAEWYASSSMLDIGDGNIPNNIAYYIEGTETAVTTLKLKLNINEPDNADGAESRFKEFGDILIRAATGNAVPWHDTGDIDLQIGLHRIRAVKSEWPARIPGRYDKILTVSV